MPDAAARFCGGVLQIYLLRPLPEFQFFGDFLGALADLLRRDLGGLARVLGDLPDRLRGLVDGTIQGLEDFLVDGPGGGSDGLRGLGALEPVVALADLLLRPARGLADLAAGLCPLFDGVVRVSENSGCKNLGTSGDVDARFRTG